MIQSRSLKSTTRNSSARASVSILAASGPNDEKLRTKAGTKHYEIRRVTKQSRTGVATYELAIFDEDELIDKHVIKGRSYADAVCDGIEFFVRFIYDD